jgi:hypothetical protein
VDDPTTWCAGPLPRQAVSLLLEDARRQGAEPGWEDVRREARLRGLQPRDLLSLIRAGSG